MSVKSVGLYGELALFAKRLFLLATLLGAVRQGLFHAQFGAGSEASAFYAALRLPDVLFNLLAGGALSSALITFSVMSMRALR